jgi:6-phosphogluconolactonase
VPRAFHLDPSGRFLYAAGLETGRLVSYAVNANSGGLSRLASYEVGAKPMWVLPVELG